MATAVQEIIRLADRLRECEERLERADSIDQAIAEAEERLAKVRADEAVARIEAARQRQALNEQEAGFRVQAEAIRRSAEADAAKARSDCSTECARQVAAAEAKVADLSYRAEQKVKEIQALEEHESKVGASVAALQAELDALKARVLG